VILLIGFRGGLVALLMMIGIESRMAYGKILVCDSFDLGHQVILIWQGSWIEPNLGRLLSSIDHCSSIEWTNYSL